MVISAAEKAIVGDADSGTSDGVILIEETDRNEGFRTKNRVTYHLRAKILSADGRGLADVTIPFNRESSKLKRWWGRTILPNGTVIDVEEESAEGRAVEKVVWAVHSLPASAGGKSLALFADIADELPRVPLRRRNLDDVPIILVSGRSVRGWIWVDLVE